MTDSLKSVSEWYAKEESYEYMPDATKKGLKIWEREVISTFFPEGAHILVIGCGMGREIFPLYDMGFRVTGVDISEPVLAQAIATAVETNREIKFLQTNGLDLPFTDESFDVIIIWAQTYGLLYGGENKLHVLHECYRVLREGGLLSFSGHDREYLETNYPQYLENGKFHAYSDCYWETFMLDEMSGTAEKSGFQVLSCLRGEVYTPEDGTILHCVSRK